MIDTRSDMTVVLRDHMGGDESIIEAMLVSSQDDEITQACLEESTTYGRINFLMANRHGTPFEHNAMKFYVEAPIVVFREWHRHRIAWSYNEMSGRYKELAPTFYVPDRDRALVQEGKPGHYIFVPGTPEQYRDMVTELTLSYNFSYDAYQNMMAQGIAKEVARLVLPVGLYSAMYATTNARALMAFLSLRTIYEDSKFPSYPQREIEMAAEHMEGFFAELFPLTYRSFCENGRVSP